MAAQDSASTKPPQPPRPPNSWILYRSFMMKKLQPKDSQDRRLSQSEMSGLISSMWKNATADVKREFEEMAERMKLEHQAKYPNYKYQPRKKEEKERVKEMQKQQRATQKRDSRSKRGVSGSSSSMPPTPLPPALNPYYNPHTLSLATALSPPLSAAASPPSTDSLNATPLLPPTPLPLASPKPSHPRLGSEPLTASQLIPPMHFGSYVSSPSVAASSAATPELLPCLPSSDMLTSASGPQAESSVAWPNMASESQDDNDLVCNTNTLSFDIGNNWSDMLDPELASFLSTSTPGMFQVQGLDNVDFGSGANSELELSVPDFQVSTNIATFARPASDKHYADDASGSTLHAPMASSFAPPDHFDFSALLNPYPVDSADVAIHNMGLLDRPYSTDDYLNSYDDQLSPIEPSQPSLEVVATLTPALMHIPSSTSSYVPPSGAAHSATRRVGGNWSRPPFISA